jgi:hypothetical protein
VISFASASQKENTDVSLIRMVEISGGIFLCGLVDFSIFYLFIF